MLHTPGFGLTCFSESPDNQMPSFKSSLTLYLLNHSQWFVVVVLCKTWYSAVSSVLKPASVQSTASVGRSTLSTLSTLAKIRSPWSDHACIHKGSSAMKFMNWPLSWLPSQLFGIKSLILYGLAVSAGPAENLCMALEMLLIASSLPVCISPRTCCRGVCHLLSDLPTATSSSLLW